MGGRGDPGEVIGVPGGSLTPGAGFVVNDEVAAMGARGELLCATVLDEGVGVPGGGTVLHDLSIPGSNANIDHALVVGNRVWLIDAKMWKPGFYWRQPFTRISSQYPIGRAWRRATRWTADKTAPRRQAERFPPADKPTMAMSVDKIRRHLARRGVPARLITPLVVVWASHDRDRLSVWALHSMPGARLILGRSFPRWVARHCHGHANQVIVSVLRPLVRSPHQSGR